MPTRRPGERISGATADRREGVSFQPNREGAAFPLTGAAAASSARATWRHVDFLRAIIERERSGATGPCSHKTAFERELA